MIELKEITGFFQKVTFPVNFAVIRGFYTYILFTFSLSDRINQSISREILLGL